LQQCILFFGNGEAKYFFISWSWRCLRLYLSLRLPLVKCLFNFNFSLAIRRWWSDATSAPPCTFTSWRELLNFLLMRYGLFGSAFFGSGYIFIYSLVWKQTSISFAAHRFAIVSPFSFISPSPCLPIVSFYSLLSPHIFVLKSPIRIMMPLPLPSSNTFWGR
jgi:hypothetical protein